MRLRPHVHAVVRGESVLLVGDRAYEFPVHMTEPLTDAFAAHAWIAEETLRSTLGPIRSAVALRALSSHRLLQWTGDPSAMPAAEDYSTAALLEVPPRPLSAQLVAIIGCGGIGGELARHLGANGIRRLLLVDDDVVSRANLNRQYLFGHGDEGRRKVTAAGDALRTIAPDLDISELRAAIRSDADAAALDEFEPSVVVCCADTPKDVGAILSHYAAQRGALFAIASAGLDEVSWGPIVPPTGPSYLDWSRSRRIPAGATEDPLPYSFGPTNSFVAAALARDLIHVLLGEAAPSLNAQVTFNFRTLQSTRTDLASA